MINDATGMTLKEQRAEEQHELLKQIALSLQTIAVALGHMGCIRDSLKAMSGRETSDAGETHRLPEHAGTPIQDTGRARKVKSGRGKDGSSPDAV